MPRRRHRSPVVSRLTLAWTGLAAAGLSVAGYAMLRGDGDDKIALPVSGEMERLAPATGAPPLRDHTSSSANRAASQTPAGARFASSGPGKAIDVAAALSAQAPAETASSADAYGDAPTLISPTTDAAWLDTIATLSDAANEDDFGADVSGGGEIVITIDGGAKSGGKKVETLKKAVLPAELAPGAPVSGPQKALLSKTPHGRMPRRTASARPSSAYAKPFEATPGKARVSLLVGGLGFDAAITERAINELPADVTLAFAPYAKNLDYWTAKARAAGHETVLELPMEAHRGSPEALGVAALLTSRNEAENLERLTWLLSRFEGYFAVTNYLGGKFAADRTAMAPVLEAVTKAGLAYIDDTGAAERSGVRSELIPVNRIVAAGPTNNDILRDLKALERAASRNGAALGKTH
ncbi:MAG: divergent polysaccharide deacetylase family protein, partial [Pseudomonadota bacterium]